MQKYSLEIRWAIWFTLVSAIWMGIEKLSGLHSTHIDKHAIYTNLFAIPAVLIYVFALLDKRKNFYGGSITYKEGFQSGLILTVIITVISPFTSFAATNIISPEYFPNMIRYVVKTKRMEQEFADDYFNLTSYIIQGITGAFVMGLVTTAVVTLFISNKKNPLF